MRTGSPVLRACLSPFPRADAGTKIRKPLIVRFGGVNPHLPGINS